MTTMALNKVSTDTADLIGRDYRLVTARNRIVDALDEWGWAIADLRLSLVNGCPGQMVVYITLDKEAAGEMRAIRARLADTFGRARIASNGVEFFLR